MRIEIKAATEAQTRIIVDHMRAKKPFTLFGVEYLIRDLDILTDNPLRGPFIVPRQEIKVVIDAEAT